MLKLPICFLVMLVSVHAKAWTIDKTDGEVSLQKEMKKAPATIGTVLKVGDEILTGENGKALLKDGESEIFIGVNSKFVVHKLANLDKGTMGRLDIIKGKLRAKFKRPSGPESYPYEVKLHSAVAGVRGTEFFAEVDGVNEKVCTLEGLVRVTSVKSAAESWDVPAGRGLFINPNEMPKVRETSAEQIKKWIDATNF